MNQLKRYENRIPKEDLRGLTTVKPFQTIRVNTLKTTKEELTKKLTEKGFNLTTHPLNDNTLIINKEPFSTGATTEYLAGYYITQDAASVMSVIELDLKEGELVLDMTAAPGAKTTHISQELKNTGVIIACEIDKKRIKAIMHNCDRMGCENVIGLRMDSKEASKLGLLFDKILLDAPCSAEGTLHKHPEVLKKETNYRKIISEQTALIEAGIKVLKKGGIMVYSTCAINPDENEGIIQHAINQGMTLINPISNGGKPGIGMPNTRRYYPHTDGTQGFFIARLMKK